MLTKINTCEKVITYKLLINFINKKDPILKEEFQTNNKKYENLLSTLMKKSKQAYYDGIILRTCGKESNLLYTLFL